MQREAGESALGGAKSFDGQGVGLPRGIAQRSILRRGRVRLGVPARLGFSEASKRSGAFGPAARAGVKGVRGSADGTKSVVERWRRKRPIKKAFDHYSPRASLRTAAARFAPIFSATPSAHLPALVRCRLAFDWSLALSARSASPTSLTD